MTLKAGRVKNFADSMAAAMEQAFKSEWDDVKDTPLPAAGEEDRKILFAAVAQGILKYLKAHESDLMTTSNVDTASGHSHTLNLNVGSE